MQDKSGFSHRIKKPACRLLLGCRCVHPKGTSYGRPHWAIRGACPHWAVRGGRCASLRSALRPSIRNSRSILYDRCAGVPPVRAPQGYFLRAPALGNSRGRCASLRSALRPNIRNSRSILKATPHKDRLTA